MRTLWRALKRSIFWSYERGTWPYDVAVAVIVIFVLLSPRSWFHDRPSLDPPPNTSVVELPTGVSSAGTETYRVDARVLASKMGPQESELEHQLHDAVRKNAPDLRRNDFQITRIEPVRSDDGTVAYYDVSIKP